jgi:hypothetical protein
LPTLDEATAARADTICMRITVSVEKNVVERARAILGVEGKTTLNQEIRDHLTYVANDDHEAILRRRQQLRGLSEQIDSK